MPKGAGLGIDSGILVRGWCVCVCGVREGMKETYNTMATVLMRTCQCSSIYINLVDPFKIMSNECAKVKRV